MPRYIHHIGLLVLTVVVGITAYTVAEDQPAVFPAEASPAEVSSPEVSSPEASSPEASAWEALPPVVFPPEAFPSEASLSEMSPAGQLIRDAIDGERVTNTTGDPMLDDVLGLIRGGRSVLHNSCLDPDLVETNSAVSDASRKAHAAENLLKASRLLEGVGSPDDDRTELVNEMRAEAVKLLTE